MKYFYKINLLLLVCISLLNNDAKAQCLVLDVPIENRFAESSLIVDGEIVSSECFWFEKNIYTKHVIQPYSVYKGQLPKKDISIITLGGQIGEDILVVSPSLSLFIGQRGFFCLENWKKNKEYYLPVFNTMGFINYDPVSFQAADAYSQYGDIKNSFIPSIKRHLNQECIKLNTPFYDLGNFGFRANPTFTSITPSIISAGTDSTITIVGANFGFAQGNGKVAFKNANNGGATWEDAEIYTLWKNDTITVKVPRLAGTGTVRVTNNGNESGTSTQVLVIPYAHINATISSTPYLTRHVQDNGTNNDFIWSISQRFFDSTPAKDGFIRSLESWRCNTYIPWNISIINTAINEIADDNINVVTWDFVDTLTSNTLGVCFSRFLSCAKTGGGFNVYVKELDIIFSNKRAWHYGLANASGNKFDFVSVASHELGHGHQLGHVNNPTRMMHYSIGINETKRNITTDDINGGKAVLVRSTQTVCAKQPLILLNNNNCALLNSVVGFGANKTAVCLQEDIIFSDSTKGGPLTWLWSFGLGSTPLTAVGIGPHTVRYTTGGNKDISLTITTVTGPQIINKPNYIKVANDAKIQAGVSFSNFGNNIFRFYATNGSNYTKKWFYGNDSIENADTLFLTFPSPGNYTVKLKASNDCNDTNIIVNLQDWLKISNISSLGLKVYPNPVEDIFHIENPYQLTISHVFITDIAGKIVMDFSEFQQNSISMASLEKGVYFIHLKHQGQIISTKIIKL